MIATATNPFFVGGAVPQRFFVGRTTEVSRIFSQISNRAHLAIYGSPGTGKSSLLRYVAEPEIWKVHGLNPESAAIVYINCDDIKPFSVANFWKELFSRLHKNTQEKSPWRSTLESLKTPTPARNELRTLLDCFKEQVFVLLIDDLDNALHANKDYTEDEVTTFQSDIRALHNDYGGRCFSNIVTSFQRVSAIGHELLPSGSPWANNFMFTRLKPFDPAESNALFDKMSPVRDLVQSERDWLRELTGSRPAVLEYACNLLWGNLTQGKTVDAADFVIELRQQTSHFFDQDWRFSSADEQKAMLLIALSRLEGKVPGREYKLSGLDILISQMKTNDLKERALLEEVSQGTIIRPCYASVRLCLNGWSFRGSKTPRTKPNSPKDKMYSSA